MKTFRKQGFTLIEILIVITIIGILAALTAHALGATGGIASRDAIRISNIQQIASVVGSLQNRYHVPPLSGTTGKYPSNCKGTEGSNLFTCLKELHVMSDEELRGIFSDPKQGITLNKKQFNYSYVAKPDGFKVCAFLEDQGDFEHLNATDDGKISSTLVPGKETDYMYCVMQGKRVDTESVTAIKIPTE